MKYLQTLLFFQLYLLSNGYCQQNDSKELATQAINYFNGNGVKKSLSKAEDFADQAILYGSRDERVFRILKEVAKKNFKLTNAAKKAVAIITIDPEKKFDYCLVLDQLVEKSTLPDNDKNNLNLYYLLHCEQNTELEYVFKEIHIFNFGDPATLIGLMPFGDPATITLKDSCFTDIVCKKYLANKKLYSLTEEDIAFKDFYFNVCNGNAMSFTSVEDLTRSKKAHIAFLEKFPNSKYVKLSLQNVNVLLGNRTTATEQVVDKEKIYFWEDSYYQSHKPVKKAFKSKYPFWMKFDTIQSKVYQGLFITERNASFHDMFFNSTGEYLLVMDGPFFFNTYKAGKPLTDNERSILKHEDFASVYNTVVGYAAIRVPGQSRKMDSLLNLLDLTKDNFRKERLNVSDPGEIGRSYIANIDKECGKQEHIEYNGGLHNHGDTLIYSTGGYYKDHMDIFMVDTKTGNLVRGIRFNLKPYANLVGLEYQFSPDLSKVAIQSRFKYSDPSEEPYHDAYASVQWSAMEILSLDDDNNDIIALNDSKNQLAQTNYTLWEHDQSEARYQKIQANNRAATGTMAEKLKQIDDMKRQWDNEAEADRQKREEQKWVIVDCPSCNGIGKIMGSTCFRCNGLGKIKIRRQ